MTEAFTRLLELCDRLARLAGELDHPCNGTPCLYPSVEPSCLELEGHIGAATPELIERVSSDPQILAYEPDLHRLRAAYEYDKEVVRAHAILEDGHDPARLSRFLREESYWALGPELRAALAGRRSVLVAGSGPLPLTALTIASELDVPVTAVERAPEASELGERVIRHAGYGGRIDCITSDLVELDRLDRFDAIVGAVLIGVDGRDGRDNRKSEIFSHVLDRMAPGATLILRDPHGLGRLLYPALSLPATGGAEFTRHVPETGPNGPYRSALVVARRAGLEVYDAQPSPLRLHP